MLLQHGFRTVVVSDAVADRSPQAHQANLSEIDAKYADVVTAREVHEHLRGLGEGSGLAAAAAEDFQRWWRTPGG